MAFEDRLGGGRGQWGVRGYVHKQPTGERFEFLIPEDLIFSLTGQEVLGPADLVQWARTHLSQIEKFCADYVGAQADRGRPLADGDRIIVWRV